ncbi:hypothetical protein E2C01_038553 [Portunus trituberculatus]|uniref:Uncharacterized protein n=1 Tax=Portunus trituberculatus TaxID=210409 RepID=A0A5B7FEF7_PORTR|nr:hypothetical protein [Portunus trituberculatus]
MEEKQTQEPPKQSPQSLLRPQRTRKDRNSHLCTFTDCKGGKSRRRKMEIQKQAESSRVDQRKV